MLVSIIIVSRNSKNVIRRCLDSVFNQTYQDIEIVIVDSSNDGTEMIFEEYRNKFRFPVKVILQEPLGVGIARNTGIENSKGEVLVFVDADCWINSDFVDKIAKSFSASDKLLTVYTEMNQVTPKGIFPQLVNAYENVMFHDDAAKIRSEQLSPYVVRKKIFELIGLYNPDLRSGEDTELFNRLITKKEQLSKQGYKFESILDAHYYEEKQGLGFFEYYKRCIWYGKPLANINYIKSDPFKNLMRILFGLYSSILLIFPIFAYLIRPDYPIIIAGLIPLFFMVFYIIIKSVYIGKFTWLLLLMPVLLIYKFVFSFIGFVRGLAGRHI